MKTGTRLPIKRLIANVPEVGYELHSTELGKSTGRGMVHALVANDSQTWSLLAVDAPGPFTDGSVTAKAFSRHYKEVQLPPHWRETFGIAMAVLLSPPTIFESREKHNGTINANLEKGRSEAHTNLRDFLDENVDGNRDALLTPSLYRSRLVPMPPSIARYAVMFYVSSLVRYRPSLLDSQSKGKERWLLDAFTDQAPIHMLRAALSGIKQTAHMFLPSGVLRR
jgi:hypothetical protein